MSCDYQHLNDLLVRAGIPLSPAEAQGIACGLAATGMEDLHSLWHQVLLEDVDPDDALVGECRRGLDVLLDDTLVQLDDEAFGLSLCLPGEEATATQHAEALRDWAAGFLFGYGLGGESLHRQPGAEAAEALQDLAEISRLDTETVEDDEQGELDLNELAEYLKVVALTLRQDVMSTTRPEKQE